MPPSFANAIVVCSCGGRWGNAARAKLGEELQDLEYALVVSAIYDLKRHWSLGHTLTGRGGATVRALIERAAANLARQGA